jgi:hypothetical protein
MGVLGEVASKVEAMKEPAARITRLTMEAGIGLMAGGLRFADKEIYFLMRKVKKKKGKSSQEG